MSGLSELRDVSEVFRGHLPSRQMQTPPSETLTSGTHSAYGPVFRALSTQLRGREEFEWGRLHKQRRKAQEREEKKKRKRGVGNRDHVGLRGRGHEPHDTSWHEITEARSLGLELTPTPMSERKKAPKPLVPGPSHLRVAKGSRLPALPSQRGALCGALAQGPTLRGSDPRSQQEPSDLTIRGLLLSRVANGSRTRDLLDHNQALYQLSYSHHATPNRCTT